MKVEYWFILLVGILTGMGGAFTTMYFDRGGHLPKSITYDEVVKVASAQSRPLYNPTTVDLPRGEFMYIIPKDLARELFPHLEFSLRNVYVVRVRNIEDSGMSFPRSRIIFYTPGNSPGSWEEILYIQEH